MKGRAVDLALIVGLVLVAGAIVWTLFSLGRSPSAPQPDGGPSVTLPAGGDDGGVGNGAAGPGIVPVSPGGDAAANGAGASDAAGDAAGGSADAANGAADAGASSADAGDASTHDDGGGAGAASGGENADAAADGAADGGPAASDRPDPEVPAASAPPVPESGPVELGRIGFSYVTGGAGACGIVLEPWTHVAVSRELLDAYGCGAEVTVTLDDPKDGRTSIEMIVADTMNESFSRTANLYVGQDEPALAYGLTSGTIEPR